MSVIREPRRPWSIAAVAMGLVIAASGVGAREPDAPGKGGLYSAAVLNVLVILTIVYLVVFVVLAAQARMRFGTPGQRSENPPVERRHLVIALLVIAGLILAVPHLREGPAVDPLRGRGEVRDAPAKAPPKAAPAQRPNPLVVSLGVVATLAALAGGVARARRRRSRRVLDEPAVDAPVLATVGRVSVEALLHEPDARRAVIAAFAAMESLLNERGLGRRPAEAPVAYVERVLAAIAAPHDAVAALTPLFERARFSPHEIDEQMRVDAITAFTALRDAARSAGAPP